MIDIKNMNCMDLMKEFKDNHFDLAIVDPPYFSGPEKRKYYGSEFSGHGVKRIDYKPLNETWSVPSDNYYQELCRVSKHQIIWGINYFNDFKGVPVGRIVWDKVNDKSSFSDCEIASCSMIKVVRIFRFMWVGMMQGKSISQGSTMQGNKELNQKKIHPTEKPILLYKWLLSKYAKTGDKILDTHLGSGSHAIACNDLGFDLVASELNKDYYEAALKRLKQHQSQTNLFT